jgi:6-phosphogluconolactonase (cycloisomerase 2 family)
VSSGASRLYVGCYTASSGGTGLGVSILERSGAGQPWSTARVAPVDDPSFIALTEGEVHAVSETAAGRLVSFTISGGDLVPASIAASGGTAPCHVVLDPASGALVVSNYTAGTFGVLSADGLDPARVANVLPLPTATGPVVDRQEAPHAHSATPTPWGTLLISDLGSDRLYEVRVDPVTLEPAFVRAHAVPKGAGPRHLAWWGDRLLVAGELDGRVHVLERVEDSFAVSQSISACDASTSRGTGEVLLSHIEVVGDLVYVAVRGRDSISVLSASGSQGGRPLSLVAEVPCGGRWPRHFTVLDGPGSSRELVVANQLSDSITVLPLDAATGVPGAVSETISTGSPSCVVVGP